MAKKDFKSIEGSMKGKIGIVCGLGASLKPYMKEFSRISEEEQDKYCFIGCNHINSKAKIIPDFWVVANSEFTVPKYFETMNRHKDKTTLLYAYSVDETPPDQVDTKLDCDYIPYSEREVLVNEGDSTIMKYVQDMTGHSEPYVGAGTVAVHMLATAIIAGCNPIYVAGVDMDYSQGYCDGTTNGRRWLKQYVPNIQESFNILRESAENIGIEIFNLNPNPHYNSLPVAKLEKLYNE